MEFMLCVAVLFAIIVIPCAKCTENRDRTNAKKECIVATKDFEKCDLFFDN